MSLYPNLRFLLSVNGLEQLPEDSGAEVAFAGRSNAGKSSAINAILERRNIARSSKTPGRTQLINLFELAPGQRLADLPGYGYAKVPADVQRHWQDLVGGYLQARQCLSGLFLVVDARRGLGPDEHALLAWASARVLTPQVLLSKCDKLTRNEARQALAVAAGQLQERAQVQLFSAVTRQGVETAQETLGRMLGSAG